VETGGDLGDGIYANLSKVRIVLISLRESFGGRPPVRPRARAAVMEDQVTGGRDGLDLLGKGFKFLFRRSNSEMRSARFQPPHNKRAPILKALETYFELWGPDVLASGLLFVDLPAFCAFKRVALQSRGSDLRSRRGHTRFACLRSY
jgi:hypothetical protein